MKKHKFQAKNVITASIKLKPDLKEIQKRNRQLLLEFMRYNQCGQLDCRINDKNNIMAVDLFLKARNDR